MPSTLKSALLPAVSADTVVYTAGANVTATIIGVLIANNGDGPGTQHATVRFQRGATYTNIIKGVPIPAGDTFVPSGFEGKIVMIPNDALHVAVDIGTVDVTVSFLEQTP
jgi:hypothetical protein